MKNKARLFIIASVCLLTVTGSSASAQTNSVFLPTSSKSEEAKTLYRQAIDHLVRADHAAYVQLITDAAKADPDYFMAQAHLAFNSITDGATSIKNNEKIEKALAIPEEGLTDAEKKVREILVKIKEDPKSDLTPLTDQLVSAYPDTREAYGLSRAIATYIENDKEAGFKYAQQMVTLDPDFGPAHNYLGYAYMDMGQMDKAKEEFQEYLRLSPDDANAHDSMGEFYMVNGDYKKSAEHYNKAVAMGMDISRENAEKATAMSKDEDSDLENDQEIDED